MNANAVNKSRITSTQRFDLTPLGLLRFGQQLSRVSCRFIANRLRSNLSVQPNHA